MLKRHEINDSESCLNRAEEDEPVFVLRAKDILAIPTVINWIDRAADNGLHSDRLPEAEQWVERANRWRAQKGLPEA